MRSLSRFIPILAVSLLLVWPKKVAQGCGVGIWPGEYRFWMLQPDLANQKELSPFYLATTFLYPDAYQEVDRNHYDSNIAEWLTVTGPTVKAADIDSILYYTESGDFLQAFDSLSRINSFAAFLRQPQHKAYYKYMELCKKAEAIAGNPDPWEEGVYPSPAINRVIREAQDQYSHASDEFMRLRTAYQLMRMHAYNHQSDSIDKIWQEKIEPIKTNSWVKTAALYTVALNSATPKSNYLLSQVFDQGHYNRSQCLIHFMSERWKESLPFAINNHQKAVLHAMKAFNRADRELHEIKTIYQLEPSYKELGFLLLREINKVEDWLLTNKVTGFASGRYDWYDYTEASIAANYKSDIKYAAELFAFIQLLIADGRRNDKALLHICAAQLSFVRGDYSAARNYLQAAGRFPHLPANMKTQLLVSDVLLRLATEPGLSKVTEDKFLHIVYMTNEQLGVHDPGIMKDQLILYAGRQLIRKGERVKGLMLLGKTHRALGQLSIGSYKSVYDVIWETATAADYDSILYKVTNYPPTAFEQFVARGLLKDAWNSGDDPAYAAGWDTTKLKLLKVGLLIRQDSLKLAIGIIRQLPDTLWNEYPYSYVEGNPFYVNINHPHRKDSIEQNYKVPNIIEQMIALQQKAVEDKGNAALYYYKLGNAYFNLTYHGKNWVLSKPWWSRMEEPEYSTRNIVGDFNENYYGCARAKQYYLKAIAVTKDKQLASLCCMMAGKCQEHYRDYLSAPDKQEGGGKFVNPFIQLLKKKKMGTSYYDEIIEECDTYNNYIVQLIMQ